jgi:hypothetical protein
MKPEGSLPRLQELSTCTYSEPDQTRPDQTSPHNTILCLQLFGLTIFILCRPKTLDTCKEVGLEVKVEKTKYMLVSRDQNAGQNREIKIGNRQFENVSQFKYLRTTVTNLNLIQEEIKRRLNSGNAC